MASYKRRERTMHTEQKGKKKKKGGRERREERANVIREEGLKIGAIRNLRELAI